MRGCSTLQICHFLIEGRSLVSIESEWDRSVSVFTQLGCYVTRLAVFDDKNALCPITHEVCRYFLIRCHHHQVWRVLVARLGWLWGTLSSAVLTLAVVCLLQIFLNIWPKEVATAHCLHIMHTEISTVQLIQNYLPLCWTVLCTGYPLCVAWVRSLLQSSLTWSLSSNALSFCSTSNLP